MMGRGPFVRRQELQQASQAKIAANEHSFGQQSPIVAIKNATGEVRLRGECVPLSEPLTTDLDRFDNDPLYAANGPPELARFAILNRKLEEGDVDPTAIVSGMAFAWLTGDIGKQFAAPAEDYSLETADQGPVVVIDDPGPSGERRVARVLIVGTSSTPESGTGRGVCPCGTRVTGVVEIPGWTQLAAKTFEYPFPEPVGLQDLSYDAETGEWVTAPILVPCVTPDEDPYTESFVWYIGRVVIVEE